MPIRNGVRVATKNPNKKPVWEMTLEEQKDDTTVVFDFEELLEFAEGDIGPVFGPEFSIIDNYQRRVRLPAREYLLVSRVTKMNAEPNKFVAGATMTTEYDLPVNGELSMGGDIPWAILVESGQCDLMLISYMGIDFQCKSNRVYRLLDTTLTFYGVASEGETLVYDIKVNGFAKGQGGQVSMFFFDYNCYCNGKLLIEMRNGAAGFFTNEELAAGKGAVRTKKEIEERKRIKEEAKTKSKPIIESMMKNPCWTKTTFSEPDMQKLVNKKWGDVMGNSYSLDYRLTTPKMLMIDRIPHLDPFGGIHGLGLLVGEKLLDPNHWYFPCHFVKDQVMAGSLVSDGCSQLMKVYMMWLGLNGLFADKFQFRPVDGQKNKVRCRGQISPHRGKLVYVMEIKEIGYDKENLPYAIADVDIIDVDYDKGQEFEWNSKEELESKLEQYGKGDLNKKIVVDFKGIALRMVGVNSTASAATSSHDLVINRSTIVSPPAGCLSTDSSPPKEVTWHPLYDVLKAGGAPIPKFNSSKLPPRPICFAPFLKNGQTLDEVRKIARSGKKIDLKEIFNEIDLNFNAAQFPVNFYNMCEFQCGWVSRCFGDEYKIFDDSKTSRAPVFDLGLVTRVIKLIETEKKNVHGVDVDPGKGTVIGEFDCPEDAWFFDAFNANGKSGYSHMPYSILMELGLQASGVLTTVLKAPLTMKKRDIVYRNLDASTEMSNALKTIDFRGKTIINRTKAIGYTMLGPMGIHRFEFELFLKEKDDSSEQRNLDHYVENYEKINIDDNKTGCFYKGEASFGWFVPEVFENQVGLDSGKKTQPHFMTDEGSNLRANLKTFPQIDTDSGKLKFVNANNEASWNDLKLDLLRAEERGQFLDEINISKEYAHGKKDVDTSDWFFSCHFWNDPVMPGSLGVESMFQLMEFYAIENDLFKNLVNSPAEGAGNKLFFRHPAAKTEWKYRGQLTAVNKRMDSEVFIKKITVNNDCVEIVADGNLFVDNLRVYQVKNMILELAVRETSNGVKKSITNGSSAVSNKLYFTNSTSQAPSNAIDAASLSVNQLKEKLLKNSEPLLLKQVDGSPYTILPVDIGDLGDRTFREFYGVKMNLYSGAMAKGIASAELVIAMGKSNLLGSLGAGGLPMHIVEKALVQIKEELGQKPFAVNLIHSPFDPNLEVGNVELFEKYGVKICEASAFMSLTPSVILFRAKGLRLEGSNTIVIENKLIAKCSRTEVAAKFLEPAPVKMLDALLNAGKITQEQHKLAQLVPVADDVTVEADSGGHTDNRQIQVVVPLVIQLRNKIFSEAKKKFAGMSYKVKTESWDIESGRMKEIAVSWPLRTRVGAGGGIGCPEAAVCAFSLGAAFLVTGTINQLCKESGTCDTVRTYLSEATYADITMAPAADMFEQGVLLQVLKKGTMFPSRAKKLYDLFCKYESFDEFPATEMANLERRILKKPLNEVWELTKDFYINRLHNREKVDKVEIHGDQKLKMSLCFRWYLGLSSFWANSGDVSRKTDYQIWCGPAIGAFNEFIKGSRLDPKVSGKFPAVVDANIEVFKGAAYITKLNQLRNNKDALGLDPTIFDTELSMYFPK